MIVEMVGLGMRQKLVDPIFQDRIKFDVLDDDGRICGVVFLLDRQLLPVRKGKQSYENDGDRPRYELCRMGNNGERETN